MKKDKFGFTLIELLIVIAIIAILAAIAIPNFLMAQTRSKVSRVKQSMKIAATALEAYYVDYNTYPGAKYGGWGAYSWAAPEVLTTPVAYLTKLPDDVFDSYVGYGPGAPLPIKYKIPGWGYSASGLTSLYMYVNVLSGDEVDDVQLFRREDTNQFRVKYVLFSMGPGKELMRNAYGTPFPARGPQPHRFWYDPTNGTISIGYIVRESSGMVSP